MRRLSTGLFVAIIVVLGGLTASPQAHADDAAPVNWWRTTVKLTSDGTAQVEHEFEMDFSRVEGHGPVIALPTRQRTKNEDEWLNYGISNIRTSSPSSARSDTKVIEQKEYGTISIQMGSNGVTYSTPQTYRIGFDITGVISPNNAESGLDEFNWNPISSGTKSEIADFQATITGPADVSQASCWHTKEMKTPCDSEVSGSSASYTVGRIPAGNPVQVAAGFPAGTFPGVTQNITKNPNPLTGAYSLSPTSGIAIAVLGMGAVAGLILIWHRRTRDEVFLGLAPGLTPTTGATATVGKRRGMPNVTVAFQPPSGTRPGEIGTLMDTTVDSVNISATIIDLAVRGYLTLAPLPNGDHLLARRPSQDTKALATYEWQLLCSIFSAGDEVTLTQLRDERYGQLQRRFRDELYDQTVSLGWFHGNSREARKKAHSMGCTLAMCGFLGSLPLGVMIALLLHTKGWGLVPLPIALFGIGLILLSRRFATRTAQGSAVLEQAKGFELYLRTAEKDQLKFEEGTDIFSRYLPYAMIFGVTEHWTKLFAQLGAEGRYQPDTSWYHGADIDHSASLFTTTFSSFSGDFSLSLSQATSQATAAAVEAQAASSGSSGDSGFSGGGGFSGGSASVSSW